MSEQLTALKEMAPFAEIISRAEDLYMPSAPPMSPLTTSYFSCWAFFDACAGPASETIGATILEVGAAFGMHPELLRLIRLMQYSRMGFYIHRARDGDVSILEDLVTTAVYRAIVPAGYRGRNNENWYVRLLPPPFPGGAEHVVFTTPYVVVHPDFDDWLAYFRRTLPATAGFADYERHMKYGPSREYWNDYVFEGYVNHQADAIYIAGLPDIPESRPHSEISKTNGWKAPGLTYGRVGGASLRYGRPRLRVAAQGRDPQPQNGASGVRADMEGNRPSGPRGQAPLPATILVRQPLASASPARGGSAGHGNSRRWLPKGSAGKGRTGEHQPGSEAVERADRCIGGVKVQAGRQLWQVTAPAGLASRWERAALFSCARPPSAAAH